MSDLPFFKYHPHAVANEEIVPSPNTCVCCNEARGYIYRGRPYAEEDYEDRICPWCIADGSASLKLGVRFTDERMIGSRETRDSLPQHVVAEVTCRTPGFSGWQQERWWTHCGDAAAFIGYVGWTELEAAGDQAVEAVGSEINLAGDELTSFLHSLSKFGSPAGYLFQCLHCKAFGGYCDYT